MAHGTPDWGITAGRVTTHQLTDLGELAARLGSPVVHDRRGDVIWLDSFESYTQRYDTNNLGTGAGAYRTVQRAHHGAWCWKLIAGSAVNLATFLIASSPPAVRSGIGLECAFNIPADLDDIFIFITHFDGVLSRVYRIFWNDAARELRYLNSANVQVAFATGIDLPVNRPTWSVLKLVADLQDHEYVRAIVNDQAYSLADIAPLVTADTRAPRVDFRMGLTGRSGNNDVVFLDDLIATQNEPL